MYFMFLGMMMMTMKDTIETRNLLSTKDLLGMTEHRVMRNVLQVQKRNMIKSLRSLIQKAAQLTPLTRRRLPHLCN